MSKLETLEDAYSPANVEAARDHYVVISGCSGGGKSSLLRELADRNYRVFAEPCRQIIKEQNFIGGDAIPSKNFYQCAQLCISRTMHNMISAAATTSPVFFDRSIIDAISGLERLRVDIPPHLAQAAKVFRYSKKVFIAPPWPEMFGNDAERIHTYEDSLADYATLLTTYQRFGHELVFIPKASIAQRVDFILHELGES